MICNKPACFIGKTTRSFLGGAVGTHNHTVFVRPVCPGPTSCKKQKSGTL